MNDKKVKDIIVDTGFQNINFDLRFWREPVTEITFQPYSLREDMILLPGAMFNEVLIAYVTLGYNIKTTIYDTPTEEHNLGLTLWVDRGQFKQT